ncbi:MAG: hypothetical protein O2967_19105, partial [Proteobacteria bacterium]|nr:hypothetical protein [Pseudomonadota bacterium]
RGRIERLFGTLQQRLPQELRLARDRADLAAANRFIAETFLPVFNRQFMVEAEEQGDYRDYQEFHYHRHPPCPRRRPTRQFPNRE